MNCVIYRTVGKETRWLLCILLIYPENGTKVIYTAIAQESDGIRSPMEVMNWYSSHGYDIQFNN